MEDDGFLLTFPLYLIVSRDGGNRPLISISEDEGTEELRGVALFTEELFAERTRDEQKPGWLIWKVETLAELQERHLPLYRSWGYSYVSIDTHERTGRGSFIPIEDLERD